MTDDQLVGLWSLIVSILGILVSIAGFTVAILQIRKTKSASEASLEAVRKVAVKAESYDIVLEVTNIAAKSQSCIQKINLMNNHDLSIDLFEIYKKVDKIVKHSFSLTNGRSLTISKNELYLNIKNVDQVTGPLDSSGLQPGIVSCLRDIMRHTEAISIEIQKDKFDV